MLIGRKVNFSPSLIPDGNLCVEGIVLDSFQGSERKLNGRTYSTVLIVELLAFDKGRIWDIPVESVRFFPENAQ